MPDGRLSKLRAELVAESNLIFYLQLFVKRKVGKYACPLPKPHNFPPTLDQQVKFGIGFSGCVGNSKGHSQIMTALFRLDLSHLPL